MIHFEDKVSFNIAIDKAWNIVNDKELMAKCIPTLKTYKIVDDDHVEGIVKIQLGLIPVESRIAMEVIERTAPYRVVGRGISYLGESIAAQVKEVKAGAVNKDSVGVFTVKVELEQDGPNRVNATATIDVEAEGKLKRVYDSIMEKKLPALRAEFIEKISVVIADRIREAAAAAPSNGSQQAASASTASTINMPQAAEHISYSFFGKVINFLVSIMNRIIEKGEHAMRP